MKKNNTFVGMDVHKNFIEITIAQWSLISAGDPETMNSPKNTVDKHGTAQPGKKHVSFEAQKEKKAERPASQ